VKEASKTMDVFLKKYYDEEQRKFRERELEPPPIYVNHGASYKEVYYISKRVAHDLY